MTCTPLSGAPRQIKRTVARTTTSTAAGTFENKPAAEVPSDKPWVILVSAHPGSKVPGISEIFQRGQLAVRQPCRDLIVADWVVWGRPHAGRAVSIFPHHKQPPSLNLWSGICKGEEFGGANCKRLWVGEYL